MDKDSWTPGYSMRVNVDESLSGVDGSEVTIETGSGGGDCGTPLPVGRRFFIFAYKNKDGKFWTGMCSGNWALDEDATDEKRIGEYRRLIATHSGTIFGEVVSTKPAWRDDDVTDTQSRPMVGMTLRANGDQFSSTTKTVDEGSYEFQGLPAGRYTIVPDKGSALDFDHEYEERYVADVRDGACERINFNLQPVTRIRGHLSVPPVSDKLSLEVVAIPTKLKS